MSYEIVKSISVKDDKVYLTSADSSLRPLDFSRWECTAFSKILAEQGKDALYAKLGEEIWNGNLQLRQGSKLCRLYMKACDAFPADMTFSTFDSKAAGNFLGKMVARLEEKPAADLSGFVEQAHAMQSDRDYIMEAAHRTGHNFLNYASTEVQNDRAFALGVLRAGRGAAWFEYPAQFRWDKDFALEALKLNGCFYRSLGDVVKADREVILEAFRETPGKTFHEHLPDVIPPTALFDYETDPTKPALDKQFIMELLDVCPSMHMNRMPDLLLDRDVALKWAQVGKFFPYSVEDLPKQYLMDKEFQETLYKRFEKTEYLEILEKRLETLGIARNRGSLDSQIQTAERKAEGHAAQSVGVTQIRSPEEQTR